MIYIYLLEVRKLLLTIAIFLTFAVFDLPSGSAFQQFLYHLIVVFTSGCVLNAYGERFSVYRIQLAFLLVIAVVIISYSFVDSKASLVVFSLISLSVFNGLILSRIAVSNFLDFRWAINVVLAINVLALAFQFFYYHLTTESIDLHNILFPFSESKHGELKRIEIFRLTGLYNEPGTYCTWIACLIFVSVIMHKGPRYFHYLALGSLLLPFSATGYVYFVFMLSAFWLSQMQGRIKINQIVFGFVFCFFAGLVAIWLGVDEYIYWRFFDVSVVDGTSDLKLMSLNFLIDSDFERLIFGSGFVVNDCLPCESIQDVGLYFNLFFQFGLFSIFIAYSMLRIIGGGSLLSSSLLIALFISKMFIFSAALWWAIIVVGALRINERGL